LKTTTTSFAATCAWPDDVALGEAAKGAKQVVPVFIFENAFRIWPDAARPAGEIKISRAHHLARSVAG
jgi:hypothetical protein